jgi:hypothetical protein
MDGLHMPQDRHICKECAGDWWAEYDADEKVICPYCKSDNTSYVIIVNELKRIKGRKRA